MPEETTELQIISYKDPAGFILKQQNGYYRYVTNDYRNEFNHFIGSGLYNTLVSHNLLLPHQEVNITTDYYKVLFPVQIPFISYPFEWTYNQWKEMAIAFLEINEIALQHGMILKDASPYNFVFHKGKCLLLDTISFSFYKDGEPWIAYRRFCEEILSPLVLIKFNDVAWGKLSSSYICGIPLGFVSKQLPKKSWFNTLCLFHIHLHNNVSRNNDNNSIKKSSLNKQKLLALFGMLKRGVVRLKHPLKNNSIWNNYYANDIEDDRYLSDKETVITKWLLELQPDTLIDFGANTGKFSFLAAAHCTHVIAVESDIACVENIYKHLQLNNINNVITVIADVTEPSPGLGWENTEKAALLNRLSGNIVMLLALVHHLCISKNIPLPFVAKMAASVTKQYAIVEFVPKTDSKTQLLLNAREDIFKNYTEETFIASFMQYFSLVKVHQCNASSRKLFLWEKK